MRKKNIILLSIAALLTVFLIVLNIVSEESFHTYIISLIPFFLIVIYIHIDVAERNYKRELLNTQNALKESVERFDLAVKGSSSGIYDWDIKNNQMYLSPQWKKMLGYDDQELINNFDTFKEMLHPDDKERVIKDLDEYLNGKTEKYETDFRLRHKEGYYIWVLSRAEALRDENNIPYRMAGSHTDITDTKEAEKEILLRENILQSIVRFSHELLLSKDYITAIKKSLRHLGQAINTDRVYYFENNLDENGSVISCTQMAEWCSKNQKSHLDYVNLYEVPFETVKDLITPLYSKKPFKAIVKELKEGFSAKNHLQIQEIKSLLIIPVFVNSIFKGFVGFDDCTTEREWNRTERDMLSLFALTVSKAIENKLSEDELNKQVLTNEVILATIPDMMFIFNEEGDILDYRAGSNRDLVAPPEVFLGNNIKDVMPEEIAVKTISSIKKLKTSDDIEIFEYNIDGNSFFEARLVKFSEGEYLTIVRNIT